MLWGVASVLGFLLAWLLGLWFIKAAGIQIDPWYDRILSGILLGSGTKPLHDLISYVQKASAQKGDDQEAAALRVRALRDSAAKTSRSRVK